MKSTGKVGEGEYKVPDLRGPRMLPGGGGMLSAITWWVMGSGPLAKRYCDLNNDAEVEINEAALMVRECTDLRAM